MKKSNKNLVLRLFPVLAIGLIFIFSLGCQRVEVPTVSTLEITEIAANTAKSGGNVSDDGNASVTSRGLVWSREEMPTTEENEGRTYEGSGTGEFISEMTGLVPGHEYYVRAYAINSEGPGYGNQRMFIPEGDEPTVLTVDITNVESNTATGHGEVIDDGGMYVSSRGFVWDTSPNPTKDNSEGFSTDGGSGSGEFTSLLDGLNAGTTYYARAYATSEIGTGYGEDIEITTESGHTLTLEVEPEIGGEVFGEGEYGAGYNVTIEARTSHGYNFAAWTDTNDDIVSINRIYSFDMPAQDLTYTANFERIDACDGVSKPEMDGYQYDIVGIGDRCWFAENLRTTEYEDGSEISTDDVSVYPHTSINGLSTVQEVVDAYGRLYSFSAVDNNKGLCPEGWRVPNNDEDWTMLSYYINVVEQIDDAGNALKSCRQDGHPDGGACDTDEHPRWNNHGTHYGTDEFGFAALPAGSRLPSGSFVGVGADANFWTSTDLNQSMAYRRSVHHSDGKVNTNLNNKDAHYSIRCVKIED